MNQLEYVHLGSSLQEPERKNFQNGNWLSKLPENVGMLASLTFLRLDENNIVELPESFGQLKNLVHLNLDLYKNELTEIPTFVTSLTQLKNLDLTENKFDVPLDEVPRFAHNMVYLYSTCKCPFS